MKENGLRPNQQIGVGKAVCETPIVSVSFLTVENKLFWHKSGRANPNGQEIRLLLAWHDNEGKDIQVNFGESNQSVIWRTLLPNKSYLPTINEKMDINTETITKIATIEGTPEVQCWILFFKQN